MMSEKYSLNEITYSFNASYMWGVGVQRRPKYYDIINEQPLIASDGISGRLADC